MSCLVSSQVPWLSDKKRRQLMTKATNKHIHSHFSSLYQGPLSITLLWNTGSTFDKSYCFSYWYQCQYKCVGRPKIKSEQPIRNHALVGDQANRVIFFSSCLWFLLEGHRYSSRHKAQRGRRRTKLFTPNCLRKAAAVMIDFWFNQKTVVHAYRIK